MRPSITTLVKNRIIEHGRGWCFTLTHFADFGSNSSIRQVLSRLQKQKMIRRLTQGVYDYPHIHDTWGIIPPDLKEVAKAIAHKNGVQIQPTGVHAANLLGLSEQVPGRVIFLSEGPSRKVKIGSRQIVFKKTTKKIMDSAGTREGLLIQALKSLGKDHVDRIICKKIARLLKDSSEKEIRQNMKYAPLWIQTLIFKIMRFKR